MASTFVGIDVQVSRPCTYAALDASGQPIENGSLPSGIAASSEALLELLRPFSSGRVSVGIDAPRMALQVPRPWYWRKGRWRDRKEGEKGWGRHCELAISALRLANPQWTPLLGDCQPWMTLGFCLFEALKTTSYTVYEVFPSASYAQLRNDIFKAVTRESLRRGAKDDFDAHVAAVTVREYEMHPGTAVGGGDGLGEIILPRSVNRDLAVHCWPE